VYVNDLQMSSKIQSDNILENKPDDFDYISVIYRENRPKAA
jgi:hypothetical protein